jgi:hypothetical protein
MIDGTNSNSQENDVYVQPLPIWKSAEWYGNGFTEVPTESLSL